MIPEEEERQKEQEDETMDGMDRVTCAFRLSRDSRVFCLLQKNLSGRERERERVRSRVFVLQSYVCISMYAYNVCIISSFFSLMNNLRFRTLSSSSSSSSSSS